MCKEGSVLANSAETERLSSEPTSISTIPLAPEDGFIDLHLKNINCALRLYAQ